MAILSARRQSRIVLHSVRLRVALLNLALLSVSVMVSLLIAEFVIRRFAAQQLIIPQPELYGPDAVTGWRHRGNVRTIVNTGQGPVRFRTDQSGYRIPWDGTPSESQPAIQILTLGDSFLEATAVEAELTIPELLKSRLSALLGKSVGVDNTGVGGWDPNHYLLEAKSALSKKAYNLGLVFLYVGNDIPAERVDSYPARQPAQPHRFRVPRTLAWNEWINAVLYPTNDWLETRSHLYLLTKTRLEVPLARMGLTADTFPKVFAVAERTSVRWDTTTAICSAIQREFAARGAPVIFVLLPTPYQVDPTLFETYVRSFSIRRDSVDLDQPNKLLGARFRDASLTTLDPLGQLRQTSSHGTPLYGSVDRHLNANGQSAVAQFLLPAVQATLKGSDSQEGMSKE